MGKKIILVTVVLVTLSLAGRPCSAQTGNSEGHYGRDLAYGTLAVFSNLLYMPVKVLYATLGGVTGGLTYVLTVGNSDVAQSVLSPALGGTYVVTPMMLRGEEEVLFFGPSYEAR